MRNMDIIRRFHEGARQPSRAAATRPPGEEVALRVRLTLEEALEAVAEMMASGAAREWIEGVRVELLEDFTLYLPGPGATPRCASTPDPPEANVLAVAQELADQLVIAYGTADYYGIDLDRAYGIVMEANMRKLPDCPDCYRASGYVKYMGDPEGMVAPIYEPCETCGATGKLEPEKDAGGKVSKPEGWEPPDLNWALRRQYRDPSEVPEITKTSPNVGIDPETGAEALIEED